MTVRRYQFEGWTLDCTALQLQGPAGPVALRPKTFEVLQFLVEHAGRVVTREEILDAIWPGVTVTEESITQCVSEVRQALGDQQQRIIKTLPRRGYIFSVAVQTFADAPHCARIRPVPFRGRGVGTGQTAARRSFDRSAAVRQYQRRSEPGVPE